MVLFGYFMDFYASEVVRVHTQRIHPAPVGVIGSALITPRLRMSNSELGTRFEEGYTNGSKIADDPNILKAKNLPWSITNKDNKPRTPFRERLVRLSNPIPSEDRAFVAKKATDPNKVWHDKTNVLVRDDGAPFARLPRQFVLRPGDLPRGSPPIVTRVEPD